ncbi:putative nuclease HARBI1 [Prorops nasuta]|uniref:putative nuclease HARBI1 n=1 Tax=Prorops nasuta TaxID=863751 RepID=UPI0034CE0A0C
MERREIISSAINFIIFEIETDSDVSSDDNDEVYFTELRTITRISRIKMKNYFETIVCNYSDADFKSHFRITRNTFHFLIELLHPYLERKSERYGRHSLLPEKQLLLSLWLMATPNSFRCVGDRFGISKSTAWRSLRRVINALYSFLHTFIKWPLVEEAKTTMRKIKQNYRFPNVIGAIDGTHIKIAAPRERAEAYIDRKGNHSLQLQAVCDENLKFLHVYCGEAGSVHDMRVFRLSNIIDMLNDTNFPCNSHILGDAAYEIQKYVMVPFKDNGHLSQDQIKFNTILSSSRMIIERAFGLLKGRFRSILDKLPMTKTNQIPRYIITCCILHNICILRNDMLDNIPILVKQRSDNRVNFNTSNINTLKAEGICKRNAIMYLLNNEI